VARGVARYLEHLARVVAVQGVPGPTFTAFERLEEEPELAAVELLEGGDRRVAIRASRVTGTMPLRSAPGKSSKVHFGPATT
jgi:hypothetical protein